MNNGVRLAKRSHYSLSIFQKGHNARRAKSRLSVT
jgi:hypothetical protein